MPRKVVRMTGPTSRSKQQRVEGPGKLARLLAILIWGVWIAAHCVGATVRAEGLDLPFVLSASVGMFFIVRSLFFGVWIEDDSMKIISWCITRRVSVNSITAILHRPYAGLLTGGAGGNNLVSSRTKMIGVRLDSGAERFWPVTIMGNAQSRRTVKALSEGLQLPAESVIDV